MNNINFEKDRVEKVYYPLEIDLYEKGKIDESN